MLDSKCNNLASAVLFTHSPQATPTSFPGLFPSRGGRPHEKGKALGTRLRLPKPNSCNWLPHPHDTHSKGRSTSFTRKMFRILTKRILTCLSFKKGGLFIILVQNSPKVTKKVLVFRKVSRSCSLTKKLLKILKVAKTLPSTIWKGLGWCWTMRAVHDHVVSGKKTDLLLQNF